MTSGQNSAMRGRRGTATPTRYAWRCCSLRRGCARCWSPASAKARNGERNVQTRRRLPDLTVAVLSQGGGRNLAGVHDRGQGGRGGVPRAARGEARRRCGAPAAAVPRRVHGADQAAAAAGQAGAARAGGAERGSGGRERALALVRRSLLPASNRLARVLRLRPCRAEQGAGRLFFRSCQRAIGSANAAQARSGR